MNATVISFHDVLSELESVFWRVLSWAPCCLWGPRVTDSDVEALTIIALGKTGASPTDAVSQQPTLYSPNLYSVAFSTTIFRKKKKLQVAAKSYSTAVPLFKLEEVQRKGGRSEGEIKLIYIMIPL